MASTEIFAIIGVVIAIALILPLVLDENPGAFLENGLCVIITPFNGMNTTCNEISGNVTFVGLTGIDVFANNTENTVYWNVTGTGNGTTGPHDHGLDNLTDVTIDGNVLGNSNTLHYNGTTNMWENINATDYLEDAIPCDDTAADADLLIFNGTSEQWECISSDLFISAIAFDNDDFFFPHLCVGEASDPIVPFTNYKIRAVEYDTGKDCNWQFIAPENVGDFDDIKITAWFYKDKIDAGIACMQASFLPLAIGEDVDGTFVHEMEECHTFAGGGGSVDLLQSVEFLWDSTEHTIEEADMVIVKLNRNGTNDTFTEKFWLLGAEVEWVSSP